MHGENIIKERGYNAKFSLLARFGTFFTGTVGFCQSLNICGRMWGDSKVHKQNVEYIQRTTQAGQQPNPACLAPYSHQTDNNEIKATLNANANAQLNVDFPGPSRLPSAPTEKMFMTRNRSRTMSEEDDLSKKAS